VSPPASYELVILNSNCSGVTRSAGVTTLQRGYPLKMWGVYIAGAVPLRVERIKKDTNESVQSNLVAVPEFPAIIASIVATLSIGAIIIIAATRMSFLQMGKMY
jgi:hypothetical protein